MMLPLNLCLQPRHPLLPEDDALGALLQLLTLIVHAGVTSPLFECFEIFKQLGLICNLVCLKGRLKEFLLRAIMLQLNLPLLQHKHHKVVESIL